MRRRPGAGGGVQYVYAEVRSASADPRADVEAVERHWKELGVTTERYQTGGEDPILGVRGRGGPVESSDFRTDPRGYTMHGSSLCVPVRQDEPRRPALTDVTCLPEPSRASGPVWHR